VKETLNDPDAEIANIETVIEVLAEIQNRMAAMEQILFGPDRAADLQVAAEAFCSAMMELGVKLQLAVYGELGKLQ